MADEQDVAAATAEGERRGLFGLLKRLHAQIVNRTAGELFSLAKTGAVVLTTTLPTAAATVVVVRALWTTPIVMTPLRVPDAYEKLGYSAESATQRLLDEIAALNRVSVAAKPKTDVADTSLFDSLAAVQLSTGGVDVKWLQTLIRTFFGKEIVQLSGEITFRRDNNAEIARLRLRKSPGRETLIDVESARGPDDLFVKSAMNLLEHIDPEIAAGIYFREYGDAESANRLLAVAMTDRDPNTRKFATNLKSYMTAAQGKIDEALALSEKVRAFGGDTFTADNTKAFALMIARRYDEALDIAKKNVDRFPKEASAHNVLGQVYQAMGRNAEAVETYRRSLEINRLFSIGYRRLAQTQRAMGDAAGASETLQLGAALMPSSPGVLYDYSEDLRQKGQLEVASKTMRRAYLVNPDNWAILVSLGELEFALGHATEGLRIVETVRSRQAAGDTPPGRLVQRVKALEQRGSK